VQASTEAVDLHSLAIEVAAGGGPDAVLGAPSGQVVVVPPACEERIDGIFQNLMQHGKTLLDQGRWVESSL
jgi:hypothetical protein